MYVVTYIWGRFCLQNLNFGKCNKTTLTPTPPCLLMSLPAHMRSAYNTRVLQRLLPWCHRVKWIFYRQGIASFHAPIGCLHLPIWGDFSITTCRVRNEFVKFIVSWVGLESSLALGLPPSLNPSMASSPPNQVVIRCLLNRSITNCAKKRVNTKVQFLFIVFPNKQKGVFSVNYGLFWEKNTHTIPVNFVSTHPDMYEANNMRQLVNSEVYNMRVQPGSTIAQLNGSTYFPILFI